MLTRVSLSVLGQKAGQSLLTSGTVHGSYHVVLPRAEPAS
jgi:hypothetical protein